MLIGSKGSWGRKGAARARKTPRRKLTGVYVGVLLHVGLLVEPLSAELAGVRPRVRVDQEVRRQRRTPLERLPALFALEHFFHVVYGSATA